MRIRRRSLRKWLVVVGCLVAAIAPIAWPREAPEASSAVATARCVLAVLLLVLGSLLHVWAKGCLEQNQRLTTAGPYRFSRNPFYLANLLVDLGLCALIGRVWVALPYLLLWWIAYRETIEQEEERLARLFPAEFGRYAAAVPRLIPTGRRLPLAAASGRFSPANRSLAEGREYARILGIWISAATLVAAGWLGRLRLAAFAPEQAAGLALVLTIPAAWVLKLAVAEVFRRPGTVFLPARGTAFFRHAVGLAACVALVWLWVAEDGRRRLAPFALLLLGLAVLDGFSRARAAKSLPDADAARRLHERWVAMPWIIMGTAAVALLIESLRGLVARGG